MFTHQQVIVHHYTYCTSDVKGLFTSDAGFCVLYIYHIYAQTGFPLDCPGLLLHSYVCEVSQLQHILCHCNYVSTSKVNRRDE